MDKAKRQKERGITLVEIVVSIFIITVFSMILITNFPAILKQFALSRATYKFAQDLRRTEDLGLSGVKITDKTGNQISGIKGYGIFVDSTGTRYAIYADIYSDTDTSTADHNKYDFSFLPADTTSSLCSNQTVPTSDCIIEVSDISKENSSLYIQSLGNISNTYTSINFSPPDPIINIDSLNGGSTSASVVFGISGTSSLRKVFFNKAGLIWVQ